MANANKTTYAKTGRELATVIAQKFTDLNDWRKTYWDRGYNAGGADPITDDEMVEVGTTAEDVAGLTTFAELMEDFMVGNRAYLASMRQDM